MGVADSFVEEIQELLDAGYSPTKTASLLGLDHKQVTRVISRYSLEIYDPFDSHFRYDNKDIMAEEVAEDWMEEACDIAFDDYYVELTTLFGDVYGQIGSYVDAKYGNIFGYLKSKRKSILKKYIFLKCSKCEVETSICEYPKRDIYLFGLARGECNECRNNRLKGYYYNNEKYRQQQKEQSKKWMKANKEKLKEIMKMAYHLRLARKNGLTDDLTKSQLEETMENFKGVCAITGNDDYHLDHVIPISIGHGGTTYGNMIPLRSDLNLSKNNRNIFEWFEANRQRFELSQERFDNLIAWLASANAMTVEEYRDYVYWCHANPRSVDELKDAEVVDGDFPSKEVI